VGSSSRSPAGAVPGQGLQDPARSSRSGSTTGRSAGRLDPSLAERRDLIQVAQPGIGLPPDPRLGIIIEEQATLLSYPTSEPQWCAIEYDQVHADGKIHLPGCRRLDSPPGGHIQIAVRAWAPAYPAAVDERKPRTCRTEHLRYWLLLGDHDDQCDSVVLTDRVRGEAASPAKLLLLPSCSLRAAGRPDEQGTGPAALTARNVRRTIAAWRCARGWSTDGRWGDGRSVCGASGLTREVPVARRLVSDLARLDAAGCPALADRAHFAACAGAAPIEASSGAIQRHRLSRNGNRQLNSTLHTVAITQIAQPGPGRELSPRKLAAGKTAGEARRAYKRHLANIIYARLVTTTNEALAGPGGHMRATLQSSAASPTSTTSTSEKSLPGPAAHPRRPTA
jgi:hypothetical protein